METIHAEARFAIAEAADRDRLEPAEIAAVLNGTVEITEASKKPLSGLELAVTLYNTREFGLILSVGLGSGAAGDQLNRFRTDQGAVSAVAALTDIDTFYALFVQTTTYRQLQNQGLASSDAELKTLFAALLELAGTSQTNDMNGKVRIEVLQLAPLFVAQTGLTACNPNCVLAPTERIPMPRPIAKIHSLLHPSSIGIIGVSASKMNFGRIILKNVLKSGYGKSKVIVIHPSELEIDGVKCVESLGALEHKLDLLVVAVSADAVYRLVDEIIATESADAVMLIPGGLGETAASREPVAHMVAKINEAHKLTDGGPVFLGGNCLGVVSHVGGYDTWFIPREKLPREQKKEKRQSAFISQSGAFMLTRLSKNPWIDPAYMIAVGNQNDLSHGDLLRYFADRDDINIVGVYIEGFKRLDGEAFARAVRKAVIAGKTVVVYKAGQSVAGQEATMGHTASIAGDYSLFRSVVKQAGGIVAQDFDEFTDLFYLADVLHHKVVTGVRIAAVSGAGFETVGIADYTLNADFSLELATPEAATIERLGEILSAKKLDALMEVRNPFDINPGADDEVHVQCVEAFAADAEVDAVVVGLDPVGPATRTLAESVKPGFNIYDDASVVQQLPKLVAGLDKPVIGIVEGGPLYEPMVANLMDHGVCTFRSCARAMRALAKYTEARLNAKRLCDVPNS